MTLLLVVVVEFPNQSHDSDSDSDSSQPVVVVWHGVSSNWGDLRNEGLTNSTRFLRPLVDCLIAVQ